MDNRKISMLDVNKKYNGETILAKFNEYIDHCFDINNAIEIPELLKAGEMAGVQKELKIKAPLTVQGFCVFAGILTQTFYNYCDSEVQRDSNMLDICTRIHEAIKSSLVSNSLVGRINPLLASRLAGIHETVNVNSTSNQPNVNITLNGTIMDLTK